MTCIMSDAMPLSEHYRLFVAVRIPEPIKAEVEKAQDQLRRAVKGGASRWTSRDQFHLTLKFLGNVEVQRVEALGEALRIACGAFAPLQLQAERLGFFPDARRPRVVWVGIHDLGGQLERLQGAVEKAAREFTAEESEKRFTGHVTLGRIKDLQRPEVEALANAAAALSETMFGRWTASDVELVRSQLSTQGASYSTLTTAPLCE